MVQFEVGHFVCWFGFVFDGKDLLTCRLHVGNAAGNEIKRFL